MNIPRLVAALCLWAFSGGLVLPCLAEPTGQRGVSVIEGSSASEKSKTEIDPFPIQGNYWALMIGIDHYQHLEPLQTAVNDVEALQSVLMTRYGFSSDRMRLLLNEAATRRNIEGALIRLGQETNPQDSVLIYFAGHGEYSPGQKLGWWVPVEGHPEEPGTYILDAAIRNYVASMQAKHVYLIVDSCFSGTLFARLRQPILHPIDKYYSKLYGKRSRWAFTSGGTEPVADDGLEGHSVFAFHLIKFLQDNQEPYLVPSRIAEHVSRVVANNSDQLPQSHPLQSANDEGGQFIFQLVSVVKALEDERKKTEERFRKQRREEQELLRQEIEKLAVANKKLMEENLKLEQLKIGKLSSESELEFQEKLEEERQRRAHIEKLLEEQRLGEGQLKEKLRELQDRLNVEQHTLESKKILETHLQDQKEQDKIREQLQSELERRQELEQLLQDTKELETQTRTRLEEEKFRRLEAEKRADEGNKEEMEYQDAPFFGGF